LADQQHRANEHDSLRPSLAGAARTAAAPALPVVLLAGFIGRAYAPKALGLPYIKER